MVKSKYRWEKVPKILVVVANSITQLENYINDDCSLTSFFLTNIIIKKLRLESTVKHRLSLLSFREEFGD